MNYRNPELRNQLAAEFVVGTLRGGARRRFAHLIRTDDALAEAVHAWEITLSGLNSTTVPVAPPERVWRNVQQRIQAQRNRSIPATQNNWWRGLAIAGFALALVLAVLLVNPIQREPVFTADYAAVIQDKGGAPVWLVRADVKNARLEVTSLSSPKLEANKSLELWLLPGNDAAPVSLGLLPTHDRSVLTLALQSPFTPAAVGLAVSLEPKGGVPTGSGPTGPVLFKGALIETVL